MLLNKIKCTDTPSITKEYCFSLNITWKVCQKAIMFWEQKVQYRLPVAEGMIGRITEIIPTNLWVAVNLKCIYSLRVPELIVWRTYTSNHHHRTHCLLHN